MANPQWPATLPNIQYVAPEDGYRRASPNAQLQTDMEVGPPKSRPRSSATYDTVSFNIEMSQSQLATLQDFYENTLGRSGPFDWIDHYTRQTATYQFTDKPQGSPIGFDEAAGEQWFSVQLNLILLP